MLIDFVIDIVAEIPLPNEQARMEIMKIHAAPIAKHGEIGAWILPIFCLLLFYLQVLQCMNFCNACKTWLI